ncbi:hypothetical protein JXO52_10770 [bacterium]|nr:hypothetical protein [bacterium]
MKRLLLVTLAVVLLAGLAFGQVNVTYRINISTVAGVGIADSSHQVQVCGSEVGPVGQDLWENSYLTWDDASPLATHVSGDIWELTISYPESYVGWRMAYKIRYKSNMADGFSWENGDNRMWVMPAHDTTLAMAYVNNAWDPPYRVTDSVDVYFRVDMSAHETFDPDNDIVYIVGAFPGPDGADNMWVPDKYALTPETPANLMWGFDLKLDAASAPYLQTMYRFTLGAWDNSEQVFGHGMFPDNENRGISVYGDTTVNWVWWNDVAPLQVDHGDTMVVT